MSFEDTDDIEGLPSYDEVIKEDKEKLAKVERTERHRQQKIERQKELERKAALKNNNHLAVPSTSSSTSSHHRHSSNSSISSHHSSSSNTHKHSSSSNTPSRTNSHRSSTTSSKPPIKSSSSSTTSNYSRSKPDLPWKYPRDYYCTKCRNTGYKIKNGKTCKDCWEHFAPRNHHVNVVGYTTPSQNNYYSGASPFSAAPVLSAHNSYYSNGAAPTGAPLYVQPGDPRLGGVLCGKCRGSGRTRFFLDENLCTVCGGIGRIVER